MILRRIAFGLALVSASAFSTGNVVAGAHGKHGGGKSAAAAKAGAKKSHGGKTAGAAKPDGGEQHAMPGDKQQMQQNKQQIHAAKKDLQKNMQAIRASQQGKGAGGMPTGATKHASKSPSQSKAKPK